MGLFGSNKDPEDLIYEAMSLMERRQPKIALSLFNKALKKEPKNTVALYNKGLALNQLKKYQDAISCFDQVIEINPKDAPSYNNRAIAMAEIGNLDGAMEYYDKSIKVDSKYAAAHYNKGVLLDRQLKHEDALECLEEAIKIEPKKDNPEKAITVFDKVLTKFGRNISVVYAMARSKAAINEVEESLSLLKEAAKQSKTIKTWAREDEIFEKFFDDPEFENIIR